MKNTHWIQGDNVCESPLFRRSISLEELPDRAEISICGLGYFLLFVNGKRVGEQEFAPAMTNYSSILGCDTTYPVWEERAHHRTLYLTFDLRPYLQIGENILGIQLGNGWYHQTRRPNEGNFIFGFPKLRYEFTIQEQNGEEIFIESDSETLWKPSEIISNNLFYGETHDLRLLQKGWCEVGADITQWEPARPVHAPETQLSEQVCPPDRVLRTITPKLLHKEGAKSLYDCGENMAGWVSLRCIGEEGEEIRIRHSEELNSDGRQLDFHSSGGEEQIQEDLYICCDSPEIVHPKFCWHGFRYFEIEGPGQVISASVVCTDVEITSNFRCSDPVLNWLYDAYILAQIGNYHNCIPSDCPHRERLGYTGDGQLTGETAMMLLDTKDLYKKWYQDILDSQGVDTGHIPHTAPFIGGGGGPGGWGGAVYILPMQYYHVFADTTLMVQGYGAIVRWLEYMHTRCTDALVVREEEGGWCLGEWCAPIGGEMLPEPFVNTYYYIQGLQACKTMAGILHKKEPSWIDKRITMSIAAITNHYYDCNSGDFCNGLGGANAFALNLKLGDLRTKNNLISKYEKEKKLDTGIFGTPVLLERLFKEGAADLAVLLLTAENPASFFTMMNHGATTLWEHWEGAGSHNHPMFGSVVKFLFTDILGIKQKEGSCGFSDYSIIPADITAIEWAEGSIKTSTGDIFVKWKRNAEGTIQIEGDQHG